MGSLSEMVSDTLNEWSLVDLDGLTDDELKDQYVWETEHILPELYDTDSIAEWIDRWEVITHHS